MEILRENHSFIRRGDEKNKRKKIEEKENFNYLNYMLNNVMYYSIFFVIYSTKKF